MAYQNDERMKTIDTQYWVGYIAPDQRYLGRMVVVLKRPCPELSKITFDEMADFHQVVVLLENVGKRMLGATMFNWTCLMNNAYQEVDPQPQVHWHFRPRYSQGAFFKGTRFADPNFGHHYLREGGSEVEAPENLRMELAEQYRQFLVRERMRIGL
jgi:diadenosine tetraphosphate (Ap4A) HIT family hydrolase